MARAIPDREHEEEEAEVEVVEPRPRAWWMESGLVGPVRASGSCGPPGCYGAAERRRVTRRARCG
jgi:hypothetical protein